jgi:hypothetical protein
MLGRRNEAPRSTGNMYSDKTTHVLARGFVVWLLIITAEMIHGIVRTLVLEPLIGDFRARQVSVFTGTAMIVVITFVFVRWLKGSSYLDFILIGAMWVILTVCFEILLGRLALDVSWERIASDYDLFKGGLMLFGLLVMLLAPIAMARLCDEI